MKKFALLAALPALLLFSCADTGSSEETAATPEQAGAGMHHHAHHGEAPEGAKIDPVCHMYEEDIAWTEMTVNGSDTTWFCSPVCKERYDNDPSQYSQNPG